MQIAAPRPAVPATRLWRRRFECRAELGHLKNGNYLAGRIGRDRVWIIPCEGSADDPEADAIMLLPDRSMQPFASLRIVHRAGWHRGYRGVANGNVVLVIPRKVPGDVDELGAEYLLAAPTLVRMISPN